MEHVVVVGDRVNFYKLSKATAAVPSVPGLQVSVLGEVLVRRPCWRNDAICRVILCQFNTRASLLLISKLTAVGK